MPSILDFENIKIVIDKVSSRLEVILRGNKLSDQEENELLNDCKEIYNFFISSISQENQFDESMRRTFIGLAVKLNNKSRNLDNGPLIEVKAYLKSISAWILSLMGDINSKTYSAIMRLLIKSGEEFVSLTQFNRGLECFNASTSLWKNFSVNSSFGFIPSIEMTDLKNLVFKCYLSKLKAYIKLELSSNELKKLINQTKEMISEVNIQNKLSLVEQLHELGALSITQKNFNEAYYYFINCLEILEMNSFRVDAEEDNDLIQQRKEVELKGVIEYKLKTHLSLLFIYVEQNEISKGFASLEVINSLGENFSLADSINHSLIYAKLLIYCKSQDFENAEFYLRALMKNMKIPFTTIHNGLKLFIDSYFKSGRDSFSKISEYFKILASRFPSDPEFTEIRMSNLNSILKSATLEKDNIFDTKARDIANRIISDHKHKNHILKNNHIDKLINILSSQIQFSYNNENWLLAKEWLDLFIAFLEDFTEKKDYYFQYATLKIDVLVNLNQFIEAISLAQTLLNQQFSLQVFSLFFKAILLSEEISNENIINRIAKIFETLIENAFIKLEEIFEIIIYFCGITQNEIKIDFGQKFSLIECLLKYWLDQFLNIFSNDPGESLPKYPIIERSFLKIFCGFLSIHLKNKLYLQNDSLDRNIKEISLIDLQNLCENEKNTDNRSDISLIYYFDKISELIINSRETFSKEFWESSSDYMVWIADFLSKFGWILVEEDKKHHNIILNDIENCNSNNYLCLSLRYLLLSEKYFSFPSDNEGNLLTKRIKVLLLASSTIIDIIDNNFGLDGLLDNQNSKFKNKNYFLNKAFELAETAEQLATRIIEFGTDGDMKLYNFSIILQIGIFCKIGEATSSHEFFLSKRLSICKLDLEDLKMCISLCSNSRSVSIEAMRTLFSIVIEYLKEEKILSKLVLWCYKRLIETSPTRKRALEKITELEELLKLKYIPDESTKEEINQILILSYNYSVTLIDLDQLQMAELFIMKAFHLMEYATDGMKQWLNRIQDTFSFLMQQKAEKSVVELESDHYNPISSDIERGKKRSFEQSESVLPTQEAVSTLAIHDFLKPN